MPKYGPAFRARAVSMVLKSGQSMAAVARDLGVSQPAVKRWVVAHREQEAANDRRRRRRQDRQRVYSPWGGTVYLNCEHAAYYPECRPAVGELGWCYTCRDWVLVVR